MQARELQELTAAAERLHEEWEEEEAGRSAAAREEAGDRPKSDQERMKWVKCVWIE